MYIDLKSGSTVIKYIITHYSGCYCFSHSITYFHSLVHPCDQDNGGCEDKCVKEGAKFSCVCNAAGKVLGHDQKSCVKG